MIIIVLTSIGRGRASEKIDCERENYIDFLSIDSVFKNMESLYKYMISEKSLESILFSLKRENITAVLIKHDTKFGKFTNNNIFLLIICKKMYLYIQKQFKSIIITQSIINFSYFLIFLSFFQCLSIEIMHAAVECLDQEKKAKLHAYFWFKELLEFFVYVENGYFKFFNAMSEKKS